MKKATDFLQTATPEQFIDSITKSTQSGLLIRQLGQIGLDIAKGESNTDTEELFRQLVKSEFNNHLKGEE